MPFILEELIEAPTVQVTEWWLNKTTTYEDKMEYITKCTSNIAKGVATKLSLEELQLILDKAGTLCLLADWALLHASDDPSIEFTDSLEQSMKVRQLFCKKIYKEIEERLKIRTELENANTKRTGLVQSTKMPEAIRAGNFAKYSGPGCALAFVGDRNAVYNPFDWLQLIFATAENYQDEPANFLKRVAETSLDRKLQFLVSKYSSLLTAEELIDRFLKNASPFMRIHMISAHLAVAPMANTPVAHYLQRYIAAARPHWSQGQLGNDESWTAVLALKLYALQVIKICITSAVTGDLMDLAADWKTSLQTIENQLASHTFGPIPFTVLKQIIHLPFQFVNGKTTGMPDPPQLKRKEPAATQISKKDDSPTRDCTYPANSNADNKHHKKWEPRRGGDSYKLKMDTNQTRVLAVTVQEGAVKRNTRTVKCSFCTLSGKPRPHCEHSLLECRQLADYARIGKNIAEPFLQLSLQPTVLDSVSAALNKPEHTVNELIRFVKTEKSKTHKFRNIFCRAIDKLEALMESATEVYAAKLDVDMFFRIMLASVINNSHSLSALFCNGDLKEARLYALKIGQSPFVGTGLTPIRPDEQQISSNSRVCAGAMTQDKGPIHPNIPTWLKGSGNNSSTVPSTSEGDDANVAGVFDRV